MHVCTYTHLYIHIYFTACGPPKHQRVMSGRRNQVFQNNEMDRWKIFEWEVVMVRQIYLTYNTLSRT